MAWIKATLEFGSFFSYRIPDFSSQYALSSLLPSPSTVKLGLVSTAICYKGIDFGKKIFELIKEKEIGFLIKGKIVVNNFLIKRLKAKKVGKGLEVTFGVRGYVFYEYPLEIWIDEEKEELIETTKRLRYLGTSDSLCFVVNIEKVKEKPNEIIFAKKALDENLSNSLIIPAKDLSKDDTFGKVNIYIKNKSLPKLEKKFFQIPIKSISSSKNWTVYNVGK